MNEAHIGSVIHSVFLNVKLQIYNYFYIIGYILAKKLENRTDYHTQ